jgi:hypothetical protein
MVSELRLFVVRSTIEGKGIAKIDSTSFDKLKLSEGAKVLVTYGTKSLSMVAKCDPIFCESTARLMAPDMDYLRVQAGSQVIVSKKAGSRQARDKAPKEGAKRGKRGRKRKSKDGKAASLDSF